MEQASATRQQKQAYIVQNIDPNYYQDFHEFCTSYAGEIDIDSWTMAYVKQIVSNFKQYLKKKDEQEDKHQKSFAVYQTTTGIDAIAGSAKLQMNQILSSLQQQPQNTQIPKSTDVTQQLKPAKVENPSKSPNLNKQIKKTPETQLQTSPKPFAKKQVRQVQQQKSAQTKKQNKSLAVALLDQIFEQSQNPNNQSKVQQSKDKINRSFFDSSNFWDVPTLEEPKQQQLKMQQKPQPQKSKSPTPVQPTTASTQSPKKQFKSIKLNMNVNQLTSKSGSGSKQSQQTKKPTQGNKNGGADIQTFNYSGGANQFDTYFNVNNLPKTAAKSPREDDLKSQFDTFSQMAEDQIQKKRAKTVSINTASQQNKTQTHSTIKLKQVRQFKPTSSISQNNSIISSKSKANKQTYKGSRIFPSDFVDQVPCVKSSMRQNLQQNNLYVQIRSFQTIQRSIFSSNYIMYHMRVQPMAIICKRNYQDFTRLKSTLQKFYPGTQLPYLEKQGWRSGTGQQLAKKQGQMLQFFMTDILSNPQLRNSRIIQEFLGLQEHKKMKRKFQEYDKMTKLKSIEELCLLQGKVEVALTQNQRIYNEGMSKLVVKLQNNMQKYRKYCQTLSTYYSQAMSTMLSIDDIVKQMQRDIQDFNKTVNIKEVQILQLSLKKIRDNYKENYFRMKFEKKIMEEDILPFLSYEKQNIHVSKQILDKSKSLMSRYLKKIESEGVQTMDSYLSQAYSQYKQGITQDSKNTLVLKYQTGYMLAQSSTELQRILQGLGNKINMLWKSIGSQYLEQLGKSVNIWSNIS